MGVPLTMGIQQKIRITGGMQVLEKRKDKLVKKGEGDINDLQWLHEMDVTDVIIWCWKGFHRKVGQDLFEGQVMKNWEFG